MYKGKMKSKPEMRKMDKLVVPTTQVAYLPQIDAGGSTTAVEGFYNPLYVKCVEFWPTGIPSSVMRTVFDSLVYNCMTNNYVRITGQNIPTAWSTANISLYFDAIVDGLNTYYQFQHLLNLSEGDNTTLAMSQHLAGFGASTREAVYRLGETLKSFAFPPQQHELIYELSLVHDLIKDTDRSSFGYFASRPIALFTINDANMSAEILNIISVINALDRTVSQAIRALGGDSWQIKLKDVPKNAVYTNLWTNTWINLGCAINNASSTSRSFVASGSDLRLLSIGEWDVLNDVLVATTIGATPVASSVWQPGYISAIPHVLDANAGSLTSLTTTGPGIETVRNNAAVGASLSVRGHIGASGAASLSGLSLQGAQRLRWNLTAATQTVTNFLETMYDLDALNSASGRVYNRG